MPRTRQLLREEITYSVAKEKELNILHTLTYYEEQEKFFTHLNGRKDWMKAVAAHHLNLEASGFHVADVGDWLHGSFNVCIPIKVDAWSGKRVLIRFPLPYRVGEYVCPGNSDEKIRCEAGTYAWLEQNCPDIPIPLLYGFGLSTGEKFTRLENLSVFTRWMQRFRLKFLHWLGYPTPSNFFRHQIRHNTAPDEVIKTGYIVVEFIEEAQGSMLSNTWSEGRHDIKLRTNLFRSLSRILLSMSRIPLPKIGSFIINNDGFLQLANRPLAVEIQQLENENIPTGMPRDYTYSNVEAYVMDNLAFHDSRFRHQPNAINDTSDAGYQLAILSAMRTILPCYFQKDYRHGPFSFSFTDLHQSNIFVDAEWNLTCLVDLEWACSRPMEMINPPYWLTGQAVDGIDAAEYNKVRVEFMDILAAEERKLGPSTSEIVGNGGSLSHLSDVMNQNWTKGAFWYTLAISSPSGLFSVFAQHMRPLFLNDEYLEEFHLVNAFLWVKNDNLGSILRRKLSDKTEYDDNLRRAFEYIQETSVSQE